MRSERSEPKSSNSSRRVITSVAIACPVLGSILGGQLQKKPHPKILSREYQRLKLFLIEPNFAPRMKPRIQECSLSPSNQWKDSPNIRSARMSSTAKLQYFAMSNFPSGLFPTSLRSLVSSKSVCDVIIEECCFSTRSEKTLTTALHIRT